MRCLGALRTRGAARTKPWSSSWHEPVPGHNLKKTTHRVWRLAGLTPVLASPDGELRLDLITEQALELAGDA